MKIIAWLLIAIWGLQKTPEIYCINSNFINNKQKESNTQGTPSRRGFEKWWKMSQSRIAPTICFVLQQITKMEEWNQKGSNTTKNRKGGETKCRRSRNFFRNRSTGKRRTIENKCTAVVGNEDRRIEKSTFWLKAPSGCLWKSSKPKAPVNCRKQKLCTTTRTKRIWHITITIW